MWGKGDNRVSRRPSHTMSTSNPAILCTWPNCHATRNWVQAPLSHTETSLGNLVLQFIYCNCELRLQYLCLESVLACEHLQVHCHSKEKYKELKQKCMKTPLALGLLLVPAQDLSRLLIFIYNLHVDSSSSPSSVSISSSYLYMTCAHFTFILSFIFCVFMTNYI